MYAQNLTISFMDFKGMETVQKRQVYSVEIFALNQIERYRHSSELHRIQMKNFL